MVSIITTLSFVLFGSLFPLCLWMGVSEKTDRGLHRFILGLSSLTGTVGVVFSWLMGIDRHVQLLAIVWIITLLAVTWFFWHRHRVQAWVLTISSLLGVIVYAQIANVLVAPNFLLFATSVLGGLVLCGSIFSMILGHRYLSQPNFSLTILKRSVKWLIVLLTFRTIWDIPNIFIAEIDVDGYILPAVDFIQSSDGFFLFIALFFGTALPLVLCLLTLRTVTIHSVQSTTGLLYMVVISVFIGNFFYNYYALQFNLFL